MRITGVLAIIIIGIWACTSGTQKEEKISGYDIYRSRCVSCHGADGRMGLNGAKDLPSSPLSIEQRVEVITHGRNAVMPSFKPLLTEEQIKAVAEYTTTMK